LRSKASSRFTEATLIRDLEKRGIGRPSTFASLVETLVDKAYVEKNDIPGEKALQTTMIIKPMQWPPLTQSTQIITGAEKQKLVPTLLGESVIKFCIREFPLLFAYDFTAQMESRLDSISQGNAEWKELCRSTWMSYKEQYDKLKDKASLPTEKVKDFGNGFKAVMSKKGPLLVQEENAKPTFYTFPPDITFSEITEEIARDWINKLANPAAFATHEEKPIIKKKGPYGEYLEWDGVKIPYDSANTIEEIIEKLKAAKKVSNVRVGQYIFAVGKYGPYMYKDIVKKKFVSIPSTINTKTITEVEAAALYKNGLEAKEARSGFKRRDKT
jgi:DNA topoisomerase-1